MKNNPPTLLLAPLGSLFGIVVAGRSQLYKTGVLKTYDLAVPVVSVGNLTVGGTGKTPLVAFVAKILAENGHRVCVLTRGYKRADPNQRVVVSDFTQILASAESAGDEAFELAAKLHGVASVVADKKRFEAGLWAKENLGATAFVLDDGFQHWRLKRDLDIVTIDATNPFGNGKLLPAGILREPIAALKRADSVIITRADLAEDVDKLKSEILNFNSSCATLTAKTKIVKLQELKQFNLEIRGRNATAEENINGTLAHARVAALGARSKDASIEFPIKMSREGFESQNLKSKRALAFCGLGNPRGFFESLRREHFNLCETMSFADHHLYVQTDVQRLEDAARAKSAEILLTTAKDAVKLKSLNFSLQCFVVEIEVVFDDDKPLRQLLAAI